MDYIIGESDTRPWGSWRVVDVGLGFIVKEIVVKGGEVLSLQRHKHRNEHWIIVRGVGTVTRGDKTKDLIVDQSIFIEKGQWHRMQNMGKEDLVFIEVQTGEILDENDIERKEDKYGRNV